MGSIAANTRTRGSYKPSMTYMIRPPLPLVPHGAEGFPIAPKHQKIARVSK